MKEDLKYWYHHIFMGMKKRIEALNSLRLENQVSDDFFAEKVMSELNNFDKRNNEFIENYVNPDNRSKFRLMIKNLAEPKKTILSKFLYFLGL